MTGPATLGIVTYRAPYPLALDALAADLRVIADDLQEARVPVRLEAR